MAAAAPGTRDHGGSGAMVLLLSLNLILLAFFIVLNALSKYQEDKAQVVLESVNRAFNGKLESAQFAPTYKASLGVLPEAESLTKEVGSLFESIIPATRSKRNERATMMRIDLPVASLFRPADRRLRRDRKVLVRRLANALLHEKRKHLIYDLDVLHGVAAPSDADPSQVSSTPYGLEVRRVGLMARRLVLAGLSPQSLSIGILPGKPGTFRIVLRLRGEEHAPAGSEGPG